MKYIVSLILEEQMIVDLIEASDAAQAYEKFMKAFKKIDDFKDETYNMLVIVPEELKDSVKINQD